MDFSLESMRDLSVIIATLNRHKYALRAAKFYHHCGIPVILCDGSDAKNDRLEKFSTTSEAVNYYHFPGDSWSERMQHAMAAVSTSYTLVSADDEFHLHQALATSVKLLDASPEASCAVGRSAKFNRYGKTIVMDHVYNYNSSVNAGNPVERASVLMRHYTPFPCYATWRTVILKKIISNISTCIWSSWRVNEIAHVMMGALMGKCLVHQSLQWLRSDENPPSLTPISQQIEFDAWFTNQKYNEEKLEFLKVITEAMHSDFFSDLDINSRLRISLYLSESYIFGQRHKKILQEVGLTPSKNFKPLSPSACTADQFVKANYPEVSLEDFILVRDLICSTDDLL